MSLIIPAIIPDSYDDLTEHVLLVHAAVSRVQIDVCDGTYTTSKSWPYTGVDQHHFVALQKEDEGLPYWQELDYEIDLLLKEPERHMEEWVRAGAACLIVHAEATEAMERITAFCSASAVMLGVATLPESPVTLIEPWLPHVAFVQVMGSNVVGQQGRELEQEAVEKIRALHATFPELLLGIDIGVNHDTLPQLRDVGAGRFVVGSAIFSDAEPRSALAELESL